MWERVGARRMARKTPHRSYLDRRRGGDDGDGNDGDDDVGDDGDDYSSEHKCPTSHMVSSITTMKKGI